MDRPPSSSRPTPETFRAMQGRRIAGRYRLERFLKMGSSSSGVFEAVDELMHRKVAVKLLLTDDEATVARFEREAQAMSRLGHPNTLTVYDFGHTDEGARFMVMELLQGRTLADELRRAGRLPPERAGHIAVQICQSLADAHRRGVVHRDIKPSNIFLVEYAGQPDFVKVLDFGVAKVEGLSFAEDGGDAQPNTRSPERLIGTPRYMPPEQIAAADQVDGRADVYATGAVLYEMLTGRPPFTASSLSELLKKHLREAPTPPSQLDPAIPQAFDDVVARALAKSPADRFESAEALREALEEVLHTGENEAVVVELVEDEDARAEPAPAEPSMPEPPPLPPAPVVPPVRRATPASSEPRAHTDIHLDVRIPDPEARARRQRAALALGALALLAAGIAAGWVWHRAHAPAQGSRGTAKREAPPRGSAAPTRAPGYVSGHRDAATASAQRDAARAVPAAPSRPTLTVEVVPAGARVRLDGVPRGTAPAVLPLPDGRPNVVEVDLPGYEPWKGEALAAATRAERGDGTSAPSWTLRIVLRPLRRAPHAEQRRPRADRVAELRLRRRPPRTRPARSTRPAEPAPVAAGATPKRTPAAPQPNAPGGKPTGREPTPPRSAPAPPPHPAAPEHRAGKPAAPAAPPSPPRPRVPLLDD